MIIGRYRAALPFTIGVALGRQRSECWLVDCRKQLAAALVKALHHLRVDGGDALTHRLVQLLEREETPIAQFAEQIADNEANRVFHFRFIAGFFYACREYDKAVVIGELLIGPIDARFVTRR